MRKVVEEEKKVKGKAASEAPAGKGRTNGEYTDLDASGDRARHHISIKGRHAKSCRRRKKGEGQSGKRSSRGKRADQRRIHRSRCIRRSCTTSYFDKGASCEKL